MAIEIRELIIRTEIRTQAKTTETLPAEDLELFKRQLMEECKRLIQKQKEQTSLNR